MNLRRQLLLVSLLTLVLLVANPILATEVGLRFSLGLPDAREGLLLAEALIGLGNVLVENAGAKTLYLAGQCGHDGEGALVGRGDLVKQLDVALGNIGAVLRDAEMEFGDVVQLNFFVRSRDDYATARREFGRVWRGQLARRDHGRWAAVGVPF